MLRLVGNEDYGCDALTTLFIGSAVSRSRVICSWIRAAGNGDGAVGTWRTIC